MNPGACARKASGQHPVRTCPRARSTRAGTATAREYGERDCTMEDVAGHRWQFAETVRDVAPEDYGCKTIAPWPDRPGA